MYGLLREWASLATVSICYKPLALAGVFCICIILVGWTVWSFLDGTQLSFPLGYVGKTKIKMNTKNCTQPQVQHSVKKVKGTAYSVATIMKKISYVCKSNPPTPTGHLGMKPFKHITVLDKVTSGMRFLTCGSLWVSESLRHVKQVSSVKKMERRYNKKAKEQLFVQI